MSTGGPSAKTTSRRSTILQELEERTYIALQRYSNFHRGAGQHAKITTRLYDAARGVILEYLGLDKKKFCTIFGSRRILSRLHRTFCSFDPVYQVFSNDLGLPLGIGALAARRKALPGGIPEQRGEGTVNLVSRKFVIWKDAPEKFESGTPNIIGAIMLALALKLIQKHNNIDVFQQREAGGSTASILCTDDTDGDSGLELLEQLSHVAIGRGSAVPTSEGLRPFVNFDNAASTPTLKKVWDAARRTLRQPEAMHREISIEVENIGAEFFHAPLDKYEVLFASNATEGIIIVAESFQHLGNSKKEIHPVVLISELEHNSNDLSWRYLPGVSVVRLPVDQEGFVHLQQLEEILSAYNRTGRFSDLRIKLVAISGCSNVVGAMNDLCDISAHPLDPAC